MPAGRPTKYNPAMAVQAKMLYQVGFTDGKVASFFNIDERTLNRWKKKHPEFCQSMTGKLEADAQVVASLFKRAKGYSYEEISIEKIESRNLPENASDEGVVKRVIRKEMPGDVNAQKFWLQNRQPELWKAVVPPRSEDDDFDEGPLKITLNINPPVRGFDT